MKIIKQTAIPLAFLLAAGLFSLYTYFAGTQVPLAVGAIDSFNCTVSTSTSKVIGPTSTTLLAEHSRRAYAEVHINAPGTVYLSFAGGAAATTTGGYALIATTTIDRAQTSFGLNTDLPYTGEVTAVAAASTTVFITECRYR